MDFLPADWIGFGVALGCGLLIGIERERRKLRAGRHQVGGVRTFAIAALLGAFAQWLRSPWLIAAGAALILVLVAIAYWRDRSSDRGITTEVALLFTFLLGVTAIEEPALAAAAAVVVAGLLAARTRLHRFSTEWLSEDELRDGLILAGAALVVLPLVPPEPIAWLAGLDPRKLWLLVVVLLALQAFGHVALRVAGARVGLALAGFASGFVSSTATHAAMGVRAREQPDLLPTCAAGALASNVSTMVLLTVVVGAVYPPALVQVAPVLAAGGLAAALTAVRGLRAPAQPAALPPDPGRAFRLGPTLGFAVLLTAFTAVVSAAHQWFGEAALAWSASLAGFADVQGAWAAVYALVAGGRVSADTVTLPLALAFTANSISKFTAAALAGGRRFALKVLPGVLAILLCVWGAWLLTGGFAAW